MYDYGKNLEPVADVGGRKLLCMGGSLMGYIQTGNPYHKDYCKNDEYCPALPNKSVQKKSKNTNFLKAALTVLVSGCGVVALYNLFKKGKLNKVVDLFNDLKSKIKLPNLKTKKPKTSVIIK